MRNVLHRSALFACVAALLVLSVDALLSLAYQSAPAAEQRASFLVIHAAFHSAVLFMSALGSSLGFFAIRSRLPSIRQSILIAAVYGFITLLAAPGLFMLAGIFGAAAWLVMGSMAFAVGAGMFSKPWRRPHVHSSPSLRPACPRPVRRTVNCLKPGRPAA
jgi:hypothetical protein